ncbi:winged helix-turn-helix domain-containing protein [Leucobacter sp. 1207-22]|uniref:winged helix-turn-helix domain-containing protein n=1 Tax=Leucobacter sp. 1207-22 TaxID=2604456 RepID=UPI004063834B
MADFSSAQARRIALAAQGFSGAPRLKKRRPFDAALAHLGVLQIDSVNVFSRSHYMPMFSRHGGYDRDAFDGHLWGSGEFTEYWAHEAALIPIADRPLFQWRMREFEAKHRERAVPLARTIDLVRDQLAAEGPQLVRELESGPREKRGPWWDWSDTKQAVDILFAAGEVVAATREGFQRRYALAEHVLPGHALEDCTREDAQRELVSRAGRALGIGTLADLGDYYRLKPKDAAHAVRALEDAGELLPVTVEGWVDNACKPQAAWLHRDARIPSRLAPHALLTPFDPMVWFRPRAERMFDFHYRIEIYTPKEKRKYGYYCLPLMVSGQLAGRIDLKADRAAKNLLVQAAWQEPGAPVHTAEVAAELLQQAADWHGLERIVSSGIGNLALPTSVGGQS